MIADGLPPPFPPAIMHCAGSAAAEYSVPRILLLAIIKTESAGNAGALHLNRNGTHDVGLMQINTIWSHHLQSRYGIAHASHHLRNDYCYNIRVGAWILKKEIGDAGFVQGNPGEYWRRVGNYHSKTPEFNRIYQRKVIANMKWLAKNTKWWS